MRQTAISNLLDIGTGFMINFHTTVMLFIIAIMLSSWKGEKNSLNSSDVLSFSVIG